MEIDGLFETIQLRDGVPLLLAEHLERLTRAAARSGLPAPGDITLPEPPLPPLGRMRVALTPSGTAVTVTPFAGYPEEIYSAGAVAVLAESPGHPLGTAAGRKVIPYDPLRNARERAYESGAFDVLFRDRDGALLEGSASNLFLVREGTLVTPPLTRPILPGVIRAAVIRAAGRLGIPVEEVDLFMEDLERAEGAFLTGSLMEVVPLRRIGRRDLVPWPGAAALRRRLYS